MVAVMSACALFAVPQSVIDRGAALEKYFDEKVAPLYETLRNKKVYEIPEHELRRFMFVIEYGRDNWQFIEAFEALTPYAQGHLRSYIDRMSTPIH